MDPQALTQLILEHKWFALLALTIGFVVRMGKPDVVGPSLPSKWRAPLAIGLGVAGGFVVPVLQKLAGGAAPKDALVWGIGAALAAIAGHDTIIEGVRGGKEFSMPLLMKSGGGGGAGATVAAIFAVCMALVPLSTVTVTETGCGPDAMAQVHQVIDQIPGDVMDGISCVETVVLATQGPEDPVAIMASCARFGVDLAGIYKIVSSMISSQQGDAGVSGELSPQLAKEIRIAQAAKAKLARGK